MSEEAQQPTPDREARSPRPLFLSMRRRATDRMADTPPRRRRGIYLLPNLFTTAAMFAGFYGIVAAINDRFETAAVSIFAAMILDGLDGRVARMTNTQSAFGAEYDSLSDMVSFGLAPALISYLWALHSFGKTGWVVAFMFATMAALRLARFNTQVGKADKKYFQGLPSPSAAALVAGVVWVSNEYGLRDSVAMGTLTMAITACAALLMVSNIRYKSFKDLDLHGRVPFFMMLMVVVAFVVVSINPPLNIFLGFLIYATSGPVLTLMLMRQRRAARRAGAATTEDSPPPFGH
jgi:CDP-diacylglycerol--serine O-phosphatidyltransferase